jgi:hypothetical protein
VERRDSATRSRRITTRNGRIRRGTGGFGDEEQEGTGR